MKSGIRKKLLLLIGLLSLALIIASVLISSKLYSDSLERNVASQCAETSDSLCSSIHSEHIDFIRDYAAKVRAVYDENREELEEASEREFKSFEEREEYYSRFTEGIFPPRSGLGMSYEMLVFMHEYSLMLDRMDMLSFAGGMDSASVFYYDREHGNLVCMIDRMPEGSTRYSFPVSVRKPADERLKAALDKGAAETFFNETECFSLAPVSGAENEVFVLFSKQTGDLPHSVRLFSFYSFIITLGATLIIGAVVLLFADRLIVKNVKKLTAASEKFTSEIHGGCPEKVSADIRSKDEIGELSEKFDIMQDSILGYVSSLAEKTAKEEKMNAELGLAARIQSESLPKGGLKTGAAELCSFLKPAREVGGDLYDYFMLDDRRMFFCLADVSGKGIPASLFMMRAKELIKANVPTSATLGEFAFKLNNELCRGNEESIFITAFFGVLDTVSGKLDYLRAGHEEPFLKRGGEVKQIGEESNTILGVFEDAEFTADETELCPGDVLLMFTDGLNERALTVKVMSFAYKKGIPNDMSGNGGGFVFDCRAVNNPGKYDRYKPYTGLDPQVIKFLEDDGEILTFLDHAYGLVDASVKRYVERGFTNLMVCFGCTGGQHRSVYSAQHMAQHINEKFNVKVELVHREQNIEQTLLPKK